MFPLESGTKAVCFFVSQENKKKRLEIKRSFFIIYAFRAAMPGRVFPSKLSSIAPPPVET